MLHRPAFVLRIHPGVAPWLPHKGLANGEGGRGSELIPPAIHIERIRPERNCAARGYFFFALMSAFYVTHARARNEPEKGIWVIPQHQQNQENKQIFLKLTQNGPWPAPLHPFRARKLVGPPITLNQTQM